MRQVRYLQLMDRVLFALFFFSAVACASNPAPSSQPVTQAASQPGSQPASGPASAASMPAALDAGPIPDGWVQARVAAAEARMGSSDGGRLVLKAIDAHGGLEAWLRSGTIAFTFDYAPRGQPQRRMYTRSRVDLWRSRATQTELGEYADARFGWDGVRAWIVPEAKAFPTPARFWATTPYYFVGMPFVLADPGVRFEQLADAALDGETYHLVKATFDPGTGDSPGDYYILYIHPQTAQVAALRYIVAYPGFFKTGGHSPEKLMKYLELKSVDGLKFAQRLDTYAWNKSEPGNLVTTIAVSDIALGETIPAADFAAPADAEVTTDL